MPRYRGSPRTIIDVGTPVWEGYAVYAERVRLGTVERAWREPGAEATVVMVRSLFLGGPPLMVRLGAAARVREDERRIEVGRAPAVLLHAERPRPDSLRGAR
jgi:hypothetical protein